MKTPNTALLPIAYFPPISYFAAFLHFGHIVIEQCEHYQKGGLRNRCYIATSNGPLRLTVPLLKGKHQQLPIREVRIDYRGPWIKNHWHAIESAYRKAPFYEEYAAYLLPVFQQKPTFLYDLNFAFLELLLKFLQIPVQPSLSNSYMVDTGNWADLRPSFQSNSNIENNLPWFKATPYPQVFEDRQGFQPHLSALDLLLCAGPQGRSLLAKGIGQ